MKHGCLFRPFVILLAGLLLAVAGCHVFERDYLSRTGRLLEISSAMGGGGAEPPAATQPAAPPTPAPQPCAAASR